MALSRQQGATYCTHAPTSQPRGSPTCFDFLDGGEGGSVGAGHGHAAVTVPVPVPVPVSVSGQLGGGQHGGRTVGRVGEEGAAEALASALAPVTVDGRLELVGVAQRALVTLVRVEVLHVSAGSRTDG